MGHLVQMAGLAVQNFVSAAVGMAVAVALIRGFARIAHRPARQLLGRPGPRQPPDPAADRRRSARSCWSRWGRAEPLRRHTRSPRWPGSRRRITGGPVASQEAIKELGTNGGGFYNANSAHPFENPNALSQPVRDLPAAGDPGLPDPHLRADGQGQAAGLRDPRRDGQSVGGVRCAGDLGLRGQRTRYARCRPAGAAMEGKETRFGSAASSLFATSTTGTSTGAVNSFHDSFTAARRRHGAVQHDAGRGRARRCRLRPVRHAGAGHHHGVRRRPDGRAAPRSTWARRSPRARSSWSRCTS